jgi:hypothetical protein
MAKRELQLPVLDELILDVPIARAAPRGPEPEDWDPLFDLITDGEGIREACIILGLHYRTVAYRLRADERLAREFAQARMAQADNLAYKAIGLAERVIDGDVEPNVAKAAAPILQWAAGQLNSRDWGQSTVRQEITGKDGKDLNPIVIFSLPDNERSMPLLNITPKAKAEDEV